MNVYIMREAVAAVLLLLVSSAPAGGSAASCDTIRYRPDDRLVNIPVTINGSQLWFDVDTGARHSVIDLAAAKRLGLPLIKPARMSGAGHGTGELLHTSPVESARAIRACTSPTRGFSISAARGRPAHRRPRGRRFLQGVRRTHRSAEADGRVLQRRACVQRFTGATIPLIVTNDRFFINLKLTLPNGVPATHRVRVDTGSDDAVSDDLVRQSLTRRKSTQGVGLGTPYVDYSGLFASVRIGPYTITNVWGPSGNPPAVGMETLRRFVLTFDARRGQLGLAPTTRLHDPVPSPAP